MNDLTKAIEEFINIFPEVYDFLALTLGIPWQISYFGTWAICIMYIFIIIMGVGWILRKLFNNI